MAYYGAVEAGGTKIILAVAYFEENLNQFKIVATHRVATTLPDETLAECVSFFKQYQSKSGITIKSIGIASFGPIELNELSPKYGYITSTPKPNWKDCNILGYIKEGLGGNVPCGFDTDVNGAALAMLHYFNEGKSEDKKISSVAYCTIGTGIGVGIAVNSSLVHGLLHPEAGHLYVPRAEGDNYKGNCPYHSDCVEGMCAIGGIAARKGISVDDLSSLSDDDEVWEFVSHYLAHLAVVLTCTVSPEIIVMGGGVSQREILFPMIRKKFQKYLNGYIQSPQILEHVDEYIVPSPYGQDAGILGAAHLAKRKANEIV